MRPDRYFRQTTLIMIILIDADRIESRTQNQFQ